MRAPATTLSGWARCSLVIPQTSPGSFIDKSPGNKLQTVMNNNVGSNEHKQVRDHATFSRTRIAKEWNAGMPTAAPRLAATHPAQGYRSGCLMFSHTPLHTTIHFPYISCSTYQSIHTFIHSFPYLIVLTTRPHPTRPSQLLTEKPT